MIQIGPALVPQRGGTAGGGGSAPVNTVLPAISGSAVQGQTLTATTGTWTGISAPTFATQWQRGGVAIAGATASTHVLTGSDVGATITVAVTATNAGGSSGTTSAGLSGIAPSLATLPVAPAARWHPGFSTVTTSGGRVVTASDLTGLAGVTEGGAGIGPREMTDALGRRFWRFEGAQFLNVATTLAFTSNRATSVFMVGRVHRTSVDNRLVSGGNAAAGTAVNTGGAMLQAVMTNNSAPVIGSQSDTANAPWMVAGAQLQVLGDIRRTSALGGNRHFINRRTATTGTQSSTLASSFSGAEIGRLAFNPGSSGNWALFDLYELAIYTTGLTDTQGQSVADALADHWAIPEVQHQLILDGDSIMQGTGTTTSGISAAMVLTDPGAGWIPPTWRAVNMGISGGQVADLVTRRDAVNGWASLPLPGGQNVLAFEIGRNDFVAGGKSAAQHYAAVVAYLDTATTGVLQRGWTVRVMANIAGTAGLNSGWIGPYRALIRAAQFLTDTGTAAGQAFAGRLSIIPTDLIEDGAGNTVFLNESDSADTIYYAGDNTHPNGTGARLRVTGGTTPAYGVAAGLV